MIAQAQQALDDGHRLLKQAQHAAKRGVSPDVINVLYLQPAADCMRAATRLRALARLERTNA